MYISKKLKKEIDPITGELKEDSIYAKMDIKTLFLSTINKKYRDGALLTMLGNVRYVERLNDRYPAKWLSDRLKAVYVPFEDDFYDIPYREDLSGDILNDLSQTNREWLLQKSRLMIQYPDKFIDMKSINPETGKDESLIHGDWTYDSYYDGVWRPERLMTNNVLNTKTKSVPVPPTSKLCDPKTSLEKWREEFSEALRIDRGGKKREIPFWQITPHHRRMDRDLSETLYLGNERRGRVGGYDMSALMSKSTK